MKTLAALALGLSLLAAAPVAATEDGSGRPVSIVVTTEVLGSIVDQLVGNAADVTTLMSGGVDPHTWQPSARETEALFDADLIVANGLDLEEGLAVVLDQAEADGAPVVHAADFITLRASAGAQEELDHDDEADQEDEADHTEEAGHEHGHAAGDPHFWLDPIAMRDVVLALGPALDDIGVELGDRPAALASELEQLDGELTEMLAVIPAEQRQLVTGHGALGYFADRYGFTIVGTVVPGLSSADEPSAREIASLIEDIKAAGSVALFTDIGTPQSVAQAVAQETGATIVELQVAQLPEAGTYQDLLLELATLVRDALAGPAIEG
ncbi:MAG: metal ABC transporter substrate-binding protein [Candidatus Limnocylindrales bacterium]